jgi:hypothetical protein
MSVKRYFINSSDGSSGTARYDLFNSGVSPSLLSPFNSNVEFGIFEFYLSKPHGLSDGMRIEVFDDSNIAVAEDVEVHLRNSVRIGINSLFGLKWKYGNTVQSAWNMIGTATETLQTAILSGNVGYITVLEGGSGYGSDAAVTVSPPTLQGGIQAEAIPVVSTSGRISSVLVTKSGSGYATPPAVSVSGSKGGGCRLSAEIENTLSGVFSYYSIDFMISGGKVQVKETHSPAWQDVITVQEIEKIRQETALSEDSVVRAVEVKDCYMMTPVFSLYRDVRILDRGYSNETETVYAFITDYLRVDGSFITVLKNGDRLWATLQPSAWEGMDEPLPHLYNTSNQSLDAYWMSQDWFDPSVVSIIEEGKWYYVKTGSVVYNGVSYSSPDVFFTGVPGKYTFDSFNNAVVCIKDNREGLYGNTGDASPDVAPAEEMCEVTVTAKMLCDCDDQYSISLGSMPSGITPEMIDTLSVKADPLKMYFLRQTGGSVISVPFNTEFSVNTQRSDMVSRDFVDYEMSKVINPVFDSERTRFEPFYMTDSGDFKPVNTINLKLKFNVDALSVKSDTSKWSALGFTDEDVKYQRAVLKKTFVRMSFFDIQNPSGQSLEHYSTVFVDINMMYADFMNGINNISGIDPKTGNPYPDEGFNTSFYIYNPFIREIVRDSGKGIKYSYTQSSEGYYLYLYGNEYRDSIPSDLYLKIEFNSALDGKRTLFFNRESVQGVPLNNIFFDVKNSQGAVESLNYCYIRFIVEFNRKVGKFIYYPDPVYCRSDVGTVKLVGDAMDIKIHEAKVE